MGLRNLDNKVLCALLDSKLVLSMSELRSVEAALSHEPENLTLHHLLLKHYSFAEYNCFHWLFQLKLCLVQLSKGKWTPVATRKHRNHLLWFINKAPESQIFQRAEARVSMERDPAGVKIVTAQWQKCISENAGNTTVLKNAVYCLVDSDSDLCENFVEKGVELEPNDPEWAVLKAEILAWRTKSAKDILLARLTKAKYQAQILRRAGSIEAAMKTEAYCTSLQKQLDEF